MNHAADIRHRRSSGFVAPGFESVRNQLDMYLLQEPSYSAQLSAYWNGELVVDLVGGADLAADSITGVYSVSKGVSAIALSTLVERGLLNLDARVVDYWPEFGTYGKDALLVRELFGHQSGLINVPGGFTLADLKDSSDIARRIAASRPLWRPGSSFGYHGVTIGVFVEEFFRRLTGKTLQEYFEEVIRAPRDIDFWLGLPESQEPRFRPVLPMTPTPGQQVEAATRAFSPDSIASYMFNHMPTRPADPDLMSPNVRGVRASGFSSLGGVGSAKGLAQVYSAAIGHNGEPLLSEETIGAVGQQQSWGVDRTLGIDMCFAIMFSKPHPGQDYGSFEAFGHDGAGGALGFADPTYGLGFGYIPMPMQYPGGADPKGVQLSHTIRRCIVQLA